MSLSRVVHGDARDILPTLATDPSRTVVITDPPWPDCEHVDIEGADDALGLWRDVAALLPAVADRLIMVLGSDTDPRGMLEAVPPSLPFITTLWLRYARPAYRGPIMRSADVAYCFGRARLHPGSRVLPGEYVSTRSRDRTETAHPCPRNLQHMRWLVGRHAAKADLVIDPFCGSGTTLVAAAELGIPAIGFDVDARWVAETNRRLASITQELLFAGAPTDH